MNNERAAGGVLDRRVFVARLLEQLPEALVVTGLGSPTYDVFAAGDRPGNFYLWGAMGGASSVGLGLALAQPGKSVVVITGDGEQMMGLGSLATIGATRPANLTVVVLDNGHFGETGMQRSHTGLCTDLAAVAAAVGIPQSMRIASMEQLPGLAGRIRERDGPALAQVLISASEPPRALPPRDGSYVKNRFRAHLGLQPF